jgi:hypothetical protein
MDKREIFQAIDEGTVGELIASTDDTYELNGVHESMFRRALEVGVVREELIRAIDDAMFDVARNSLLDPREMKQMSRKMLEDYDPKLALDVYRSQIRVMFDKYSKAKADQESGLSRPEENLFNDEAWGHTLSTAGTNGALAVVTFTGLAQLDGSRLLFGRIGNDDAYQNLKENPQAVFSAVGPSNDPSKIDFVTISATLEEDHTEGEVLAEFHGLMGSAVQNAMVFSVSDIRVSHLPNTKYRR